MAEKKDSQDILFINGLLPDLASARRLIQPGDRIIAVDGGTHHVLALGLIPDVIIGDLDSLSAADRQAVQDARVQFMEYPRDKDQTDLEIALRYAVDRGSRRVILVAALGGRLDQTLANLSLLTDPDFVDHDIRIDDGVESAFFVRKTCRILGKVGDIVSLIPWGRPVTGVTTEGLRWPLRAEKLEPYRTRGISNEMLSSTAQVSIRSGLLLIVHHRQSSVQI